MKNRLNLLQKLAPAGVVALGAICTTAGTMLVAPSAQAQLPDNELCLNGTLADLTAPGASITCGDKTFTNFFFSILPPEGEESVDAVINRIGDVFTFTLNDPSGAGASEAPGGELVYSYDVFINDPTRFFDEVELDTDVLPPVTVTKDVLVNAIFTTPIQPGSVAVGDIISLTSVDGERVGPASILGATRISVTDTITAGAATSAIFSSTNFLTQNVTPVVPEPSAMLGLTALALGGLGLRKAKK